VEVLVVLVVLAAVAWLVLAPLRPGRAAAAEAEESAEHAELEALKEAKYREIRDADLDHRTGKLSDADHRTLDRELRAEAMELLRRLDELEGVREARADADAAPADPEPHGSATLRPPCTPSSPSPRSSSPSSSSS